jgi:hypothetical protein
MAAGRTLGPVLLDKQIPRIGHFLESGAGHFKQANFVRAAEAIFHAADDAVAVESIAFEIDDRIDDVLDDLWPGQCAGLGNVPDENNRHPARLGKINQIHTAIA